VKVSVGIVLIGGSPGVGKTTVARAVALKLNLDLISLGEFVAARKLYVEYDAERRAYVIDVKRVKEELREVARDRRVVVETHVIDAIPEDLVEVAVILRLDPRILEERLTRRGYARIKVVENVQAELLDACLIEAVRAFGVDRVYEVDTTGKSVEEVVEEVLDVIYGGRGCKPGTVNWFEVLGDEAFKYLREGGVRA